MTNETKLVTPEDVREDVIRWRRHLHANPELSFQEVETSQYVYDYLLSFGNLEVTRPTKTSVMARLIGKNPGKVIGIRADMDALPIQEENTFEFASKTAGVMHACGHDGHTAMLLGAAKVLASMQAQIAGEVRFFFQHAEEETPGGARDMVAAGVMDGVDIVIGGHLSSMLEIGKIGITYGPMTASPDDFRIVIVGKGGHGGMPHDTVDSIAIGAQIVSNIQHIVSRNMNPLEPLVVSIGKFVGGEAENVIAHSVEITGTVRSYSMEARKKVDALIERVVQGITAAHGASYKYSYTYGYLPVINTDEETALVERSVRDQFGDEAVKVLPPMMGGEDFSAFLQEAPGAFFMIGAGNEEKGIVHPHHHPQFTVDEDAFDYGVKLYKQIVFNYLT